VSRSWLLFLDDMREAARKIDRYVAGRDPDAFRADEMAFDATLRNLEILGEAVKGIPEDIRARYPEINWRGVAGFRNVLAHVYFAVDQETLWDIIANKVPQLLVQLEQITEDRH
jgi:uncharacterized protein with HEPN domain